MRAFSTSECALLGAAAADVEARSRAEVVIVVSPQSASYVHADLLVGSAAAYLALAFLLFSPWEFSLLQIQLLPLGAGLAAAVLASRLPGVRARLLPEPLRRQAVESAARAAFYDKDVSATRERTGVLVFVSRLEHIAVVVPDRAVRERIRAAEWDAATDAVDAAARQGGPALAEAIRRLGDALAAAFPPSDRDQDELPSELHVVP